MHCVYKMSTISGKSPTLCKPLTYSCPPYPLQFLLRMVSIEDCIYFNNKATSPVWTLISRYNKLFKQNCHCENIEESDTGFVQKQSVGLQNASSEQSVFFFYLSTNFQIGA